jgi:hypothetical protein
MKYASSRRRCPSARARSFRPCLEQLELRLVPTILPLPQPDHVVVVMEENHAFGQIIGPSSPATYINQLATQGALFTQSYSITHPSEPNYLDIFSGYDQGVVGDPAITSPFNTANLGADLLAAGKSFTGYAEDLPAVGSTVEISGNYARRHNPWVDWQGASANAIPANDNQPFSSFPTNAAGYAALPTVSFVVPNVVDDMHNGADPATIIQGDTWLKTNLDGYAQWAKTNNSLLIVTYDEDNDFDLNRITTIFVGQMVQPGQYSEYVDHFTVLRTLEDMYGLPYAGASVTTKPTDATTTPITDAWTQSGGVVLPTPTFTQVGTALCVTGTPGNDNFSFAVDSTGYQLNVNGTPYHADAALTQTILYDSGAGQDTATITGGSGAETLHLWNGGARLHGPGYNLAIGNTETINGFGGAGDTAYFNDVPGNQVFVGTPTYANLTGTGYFDQVSGFPTVVAGANVGNTERAYLYGASGGGNSFVNNFQFTPATTNESGSAYNLQAAGFQRTVASGSGAASDTAFFYGAPSSFPNTFGAPSGANTFVGTPTYSTLTNAGIASTAAGFNTVSAYGGTAVQNTSGADLALLFDSAAADVFLSTPTYSYMQNNLATGTVTNVASGFPSVRGYDSGGGDLAFLFDSAGNDTFVGTPAYSYLYGTGYLNLAINFLQVRAFSSMGTDTALLFDSAGDDTFRGTTAYSFLGANNGSYLNMAFGFATVSAYASSGNDSADVYDSPGNDTFTAQGADGTMSGTGYTRSVHGFKSVRATSTTGVDKLFLGAVNYAFSQVGNWQ